MSKVLDLQRDRARAALRSAERIAQRVAEQDRLIREGRAFDLQALAQSPAFEATATGIGKEGTFNTLTAPTQWWSCQDVNFTPANEALERGSNRGRLGREYPQTGSFTGAGSLTVETDPDILQGILALTMGAETAVANTSNPSASPVTTTTTSATTNLGMQWVPVAAMTNIVPGVSLTIDTAGNQETVVVNAINAGGLSFQAYLTKTHATGVSVTNAAVVLAYDHKFTFGSPRPTFTAQWKRGSDNVSFTGNKVRTLGLSATPKAILLAKLATIYAFEANVASPGTPSYANTNPFRFEDPGNFANVNNAASTSGVLSFNVNVDTGLQGAEPTFGGGRGIQSIPETQSKVNGDVLLQFENQDLQKLFWGNSTATGPQQTVGGVSFQFFFKGRDWINSALTYALTITMPNCFLTAIDIPGRSGGLLQQTARFEAFESLPGNNDDITFLLTNTASTTF